MKMSYSNPHSTEIPENPGADGCWNQHYLRPNLKILHDLLVDELDAMLIKMGVDDPDVRAAQVPILLQHIDTDGDGRISYEEFAVAAQGTYDAYFLIVIPASLADVSRYCAKPGVACSDGTGPPRPISADDS